MLNDYRGIGFIKMNVIYMSQQKYNELIIKLKYLKEREFPENRKAMRTALEQGGGMHDNAGYEFTKSNERVLLKRNAYVRWKCPNCNQLLKFNWKKDFYSVEIYVLITAIMASIIAIFDWWVYIFIFYLIITLPMFCLLIPNAIELAKEKE